MNSRVSSRLHSVSCICSSCTGKSGRFSPSNWRKRRQERLGNSHGPKCSCKCCTKKMAFHTDELHLLWRIRRNKRNVLPILNEIELEMRYVFPSDKLSFIRNPIRNFNGINHFEVLKRKPAKWVAKLMAHAHGWTMIDEAGNERIRFIRPNLSVNGSDPLSLRLRTGYWIIRDERGNYLDQSGNIVSNNIAPMQMSNSQLLGVHIPYTGIPG